MRITTGLRVNGPKDDAATFAIAQRMRGDIAGMQSVKIALAAGDFDCQRGDLRRQGPGDLVTEMKAKVVQANQSGLDSASRTALHNDFVALRDEITAIVVSAEFNGKNLITSGATNFAVLSTVDGSVITVSAQSMDASALGIASSVINTSSGAAVALTAIDSALSSLADRLAALGSSAKRIEVQSEFTGMLVDILKEGVGNLVDADMAAESAQLQALQIKQQLGVQALSIANAAPQSILSLFQ